MLIEFTVGNFRSFREPVTLSLEAASITSEDKSVDQNNTIAVSKNLTLLTSAAIYGANASGKSNLVRALNFMRSLVLNSARESQADEPIKVQPFRLNTETPKQPAYFEVTFLLEEQHYRYGFEVTQERGVREWLYYTPTIREVRLFERENGQITPNPRSFKEGLRLEERTRSNALFLSVTAQFNGPIAQKVVKWFRNIRFISGLNDVGYRAFTIRKYQEDASQREQILNLVRSFDVGIEGLQVKRVDPDQVTFPKGVPDEFRKLILENSGDFFTTETQHTQFNNNGEPVGHVIFDLDDDESEGTKKLFFIAGPVIDVLSQGRILVVDEMEARMHPLITCAVIRLFNSRETNPKKAQLVFTTHDTNLLDRNLFRRDQIWFTEKDSYGAAHLYSLVEFKPRNDESFERNYLRGKYGAIPYLGDLSRIIIAAEQPQAEASENGA
jgi:AAA15 family ATPase/GTPase